MIQLSNEEFITVSLQIKSNEEFKRNSFNIRKKVIQ
jgi:hypothetical protein